MKIVIIGAGDVGSYLCSLLSQQAHAVTLIEEDGDRARQADELFDVKVIRGNGASAHILAKADAGTCDFFVAMTSDDRSNIVSCSLAKAMGARNTVARIHDQTYNDTSLINYQLHFGIDFLINPEALCAVELAKSIRNPGRVAVENFARGQIEVQRFELSDKSKLLNRPLSELQLGGLRVGYVQRDGKLEVARGNTSLQAGDQVTVFGRADALLNLKSKLDPDKARERARVVLFGGGETAIALIRLLANPRFKVRVIDNERQTCNYIAEHFPNVTVIHGDGTSLRLLEEEQIAHADYFVACTKRDEDNVMTGLQASKLGAKHVQVVINRVDYEEMIGNLKWLVGVETAVSPRITTAREVLRYVSTDAATELATLPDNSGKVLEIRVSGKSHAAGKTLREIALPQGTVMVALMHKFDSRVPGPDDKILGGDRIVIITTDEDAEALIKIFTDA